MPQSKTYILEGPHTKKVITRSELEYLIKEDCIEIKNRHDYAGNDEFVDCYVIKKDKFLDTCIALVQFAKKSDEHVSSSLYDLGGVAQLTAKHSR